MWRRKRSILRSMVICLCLSICLHTGTSEAIPNKQNNQAAAVWLRSLGLFQGTEKGFELDRVPSRLESSVMLIRLLGKESAAKASTSKHPFTDVPKWADRYVAYLYGTGLAKGVSPTKFGSQSDTTDKMFLTFLLRALEYQDGGVDFSYQEAGSFALSKELISQAEMNELKKGAFTRGDMVYLSAAALRRPLNRKGGLLLDKLVAEKAVVKERAEAFLGKEEATESVSQSLPNQISAVGGIEGEVIRLVNEIRQKNNLNPLKPNEELMRLSKKNAEAMSSAGYFSHTSPTEGSFEQRMEKSGLSFRRAGENIAKGHTSAQQVVDGWMNSKGHRENILNPEFTDIGVGYASGDYWTQIFMAF